jgi:hypothetical protein
VKSAKSAWIGVGVLAFATLAFPARAHADESEMIETRGAPDRGRSAQNFEVEVRAALYQPQVDSDPTLHGTPYKDSFGSTMHFEVGMEFDWQAIRIPHVGTFGPGVSIGYTKMSGIAPRVDGLLPPSEETSSLEILPTYAVAVLRVDALMRDLHVPLVPYAKAGVGYALWRASNTAGTSVGPTGVVGEGHTFGTQFAVGLQFGLGVLDPHSAQQLDESTGINNTYIFGELMLSELTGIGQEHALYVGTNTFAFGLAFEF